MKKLINIAIIPARAGSKRLLRKNILPFDGEPMIFWTIRAAQESELFDVIVVSTDDYAIAKLAESYGVTVLMRPEDVSNDNATLLEVLKHALNHGYENVEKICLLLANCPLRNSIDIQQSFEVFQTRSPSALLSVVDYGWTPPFRAHYQKNNKLIPVFKNLYDKKSQLYSELVCPSGAIYWSTPNCLREANSLYVEGIEGFNMPWYRAIDIDTQTDLELASFVRSGLNAGFKAPEV